jgi:hypothetical protein
VAVTDSLGATCTDVCTIEVVSAIPPPPPPIQYYGLVLQAYYGGNNTPIIETGNCCTNLPSPVSSGYSITLHLTGNASAYGGGTIEVTGHIGSPSGPAFDTGAITVPKGVDYNQPVTWTAP